MHYSKIAGFLAAALIFSSSLSCFAATGSVITDGLNIRSDATVDSSVVGKVYVGENLDIIDKSGNFYVVNYDGQRAYVSCDYVSVNVTNTGIVATDALNIRSTASTSSDVVGRLVDGDEVHITGTDGDWYEILIFGRLAYVHMDYISVGGRRGDGVTSRSGGVSTRRGSSVVSYSKQFLGVPYVSGGSTPSGFDCSGFTYYVYKQFGITLPRTASSQAAVGTSISRNALLPGDLVFFDTYGGISHTGIYVGDDSFIHSPIPGDSVKISSLSSSYYSSRFVTARRVL